MSVEDLQEYGRRRAADPALERRCEEIGLRNIPGLMQHARSLGLHWTQQDMEALASAVRPEEALSDEQLEAVAGGGDPTSLLSLLLATTDPGRGTSMEKTGHG